LLGLSLNPVGGLAGGYTWSNLKAEQVLDLLGVYASHPHARRADTKLLSRYIKTQLANDELTTWTIHLASSSLADAFPSEIAGLRIGLIKRAEFPTERRLDRYGIRRLVSPADEIRDLSSVEQEAALAIAIANWQNDKRTTKSMVSPSKPGGKDIRQVRPKTRGLLIFYPLDPILADLPTTTKPIIGLAISFPKSDTAKEITYTVNNVFTTRGGDDDSI
jgi:hypothetical protein